MRDYLFCQAVLSRLSKDAEIFDNEELQCHQKLQDLYRSTRETKVYMLNISFRSFVIVCFLCPAIENQWFLMLVNTLHSLF